jgi:cytochrome c biogenesis protein CcmG, thiol:disulfide interchange protein DsbE
MHEKSCPRLLLFLLAALGCATAGVEAPSEGAATVGSPLPEVKVIGFDGRGIDARTLAGKVVLLDLWASWCAPCKEELPLLDSMATRLRAKGVTILAVSIDENRDDALGFLKSHGSDWSLDMAHDPGGKLAEKLKPPRMPTSYIIDRTGVIRHVNLGFERADVAKIEARLTRLAAQP